MDDIAKHLGMSKKTIYQHFDDKNELILKLMRHKMETHACMIDECCDRADNAIHEVFFAITNLVEMLSRTNPTMFYDLQKFYPEAWTYFKNFRENTLLGKFKDNLRRGIAEGYYRPEIDIEIVSRMRVEQVEMSFNPQIFPFQQFNMSTVAKELTLHFVYGISTLKGFELIKYYEENH